MVDLVLAGLLISFFVYHIYYVKTANEQVTHLVKLLKAKDLPEYNTTIRTENGAKAKTTSFFLGDKPSKIVSEVDDSGDLVPMREAIEDDRVFGKMLEEYNK